MPRLKASKKHLRQTVHRTMRNRSRKRTIHDTVQNLRRAIAAKDVKKARELLPNVYRLLDLAAKTNTIHWKTAARKKSRLMMAIHKVETVKK